MLFPRARCNGDESICQITLGEGEINSAATLMALVLSTKFDLRKTYFLLAGIAGVNPRHGTLGSVALARYAVQVALQYEIDSRSIPFDWPTGYIAYGREYPHEYPVITYGTEVFELNAELQEVAYTLASKAILSDAEGPRSYRTLYEDAHHMYEMATRPPSVIKCDSATSDVYYSGKILSEAFENTTEVWTNGTGVYCMSAQEDNAALEVLVRAAIEKIVDFGRIIVLRAGKLMSISPAKFYSRLTIDPEAQTLTVLHLRHLIGCISQLNRTASLSPSTIYFAQASKSLEVSWRIGIALLRMAWLLIIIWATSSAAWVVSLILDSEASRTAPLSLHSVRDRTWRNVR